MADFSTQDDVFITGINAEGGAEPDYMRKVRDLNGQLRHAVANMSDKVGHLLQEREKDFLAAYRHHMYNVQKELQEAKQKVREAELAMKNNDQIRKLKKERDWFRGEAIRLDNIAEGMRKDLAVMHEKMDSIEDDRSWLEKQLKKSKKQIKILRAELEASARAGTSYGATGYGGSGLGLRETLVGSRGSRRAGSRGGGGGSRGGVHGGLPAVRGPTRTPRSARSHGPAAELDDAPPSRGIVGMEADRERRYKEQLKHVRRQLKQEQRASRELRTMAVSEHAQRGELEEFFLAAIEDVKRDVARRRSKAVQRASKSHRGARARSALADDEPALPTLQDLQSTDRRAVVEKLLARDDVLSFLYDSLFPAPEK
jgi:hypothetical protein